MKTAKRTLAILLVLAVVVAFGATAFAANTGSITVDNAVKDKDYTLYKLFDATVSGSNIAYKLPAGKTITGNAADWFDVDASGGVTAKAALTASVLAGDDFKTWAKSFGTQVGNTVTGTGSPVVFENVPYGYYFVESSLGALITVDSTTPNAIVVDKNDDPTFRKVIVDANGDEQHNASISVGEPVKFKVTGTTKNFAAGKDIAKYSFVDTLSSEWSFVVDSTHTFEVKVGSTTLTTPAAYTVTPTGWANGQTFTLDIPWYNSTSNASIYPNNSVVEITYWAMLDPAKMTSGVPTSAKTNTLNVSWEYVDGTTSPPVPVTPPEWTDEILTAEVEISKVDGKTKQVLPGAAFKLSGQGVKVVYTTGTQYVLNQTNGAYWKLLDGNYTLDDPINTPGIDTSKYVKPYERYDRVSFSGWRGEGQTNTDTTAFVDSTTGKLTFAGLGAGTYTLSEEVVPNGYNKKDDITFTIGFEAANKTFTVASNDADFSVNGNKLAVTIENNAGVELPSTGGIGTTIFYVLGSCLLLGAAVLLITRKRMSHEG